MTGRTCPECGAEMVRGKGGQFFKEYRCPKCGLFQQRFFGGRVEIHCPEGTERS